MGGHMDRNEVPFWCHTEPAAEGKVRCRYCGHVFTPNITTLKEHLANASSGEIIDCGKVPLDVRKAAEEALGGAKKRAKRDGTVSSSVTSISTTSHRPHVSKKLCSNNNNNMISADALNKLLYNTPIRFAQTPSFKSFVEAVASHGPGYYPPSSQDLIDSIPRLKMDIESHSTSVQKSWGETGCTLVFIFKKGEKNENFFNIFACARGGLVCVDQMETTYKPKKDVKEFICSVIERIGPHNVVQIITNAEKLKSSFEDELASKYPHVYWTLCAARGIHSLLKNIYKEVEWVKKLMDDAYTIVGYMHQDNDILLLMNKYTNGKGLKQHSRKTIISMFSTLQSIFHVENELQLLVASSEWRGISNEMASKITSIIEDTEFWSQAADVLQALCPLIRVLQLVESDGSTFGYLYEAMNMARREIEQQYANKEKYGRIFDLFVNNCFEKIIHPMHVVAAFLNPRYMSHQNLVMDEQMKHNFGFALDKVVASAHREAFILEISIYHQKQLPFSTNLAKSIESKHPWAWWCFFKDLMPISSKYAMRILGQPCSCSLCEQIMNTITYEPTQSQKINLPNFADGKMKLMMMEKSNLMIEKANEPFNYNKLSELFDYADTVDDDSSQVWDELIDE